MIVSGRRKCKKLKQMKKFVSISLTLLSIFTLNARISTWGDPGIHGIKEFKPDNFFDINPHTWDVFTSWDSAKMFGLHEDSKPFYMLTAEYHSSYVQEGVKIGENSFVAAFTNRNEFFGGDGYTELLAVLPAETRYSRMYVFSGGWKYNLMEFLHIDLGGTFKYYEKQVSAPGVPGLGTHFTGDLYVGFILDLALNPFVYYMYNPDYDANKIMAGINPIIQLDKATGIENLSFEAEIYYGYVKTSAWTADNDVNGKQLHNDYGFVQAEIMFNYLWKGIRFSIGGGYSYNNDGGGPEIAPDGPDQNLWVSSSIGYVF